MELTKEQIEFLDKFCKDKWALNSDGKVDVTKSIFINRMEHLTEIPVKFGRVSGYFNCASNNLTTLKNCPDVIDIKGVTFNFYNNNLTNYFKSIKEDDFPHWDKLHYDSVIREYPFLINILKKYFNSKNYLEHYITQYPLTKLYLE